MQRLLQETETGGVVVETRQAKQQSRDDPGRRWKQRPETHFGIELGLELLDTGVVERCRGCHAHSADDAAITSASRPPGRISRSPHAAECRRPRERFHCGYTCTWRGRTPSRRVF